MTVSGHTLLVGGFRGLHRRRALRARPVQRREEAAVHQSMADISAIIYETCKTYMLQRGAS